MKINIRTVSKHKFLRTVVWSILASGVIVVAAAGLGRAARNFEAALTDKPDVALYLLLPNEGITTSSLLRELPNERDYLVETPEGPKLIKLKRGPQAWYVSSSEPLHGETGRDAAPTEETGPSHE